VRVFLDSSVLLVAAGSSKGASRYIILNYNEHSINLITSDYCIQEVEYNLNKLSPQNSVEWYSIIKPRLKIVPVRLSFSKILVYPKLKDRPVIITALSTDSDYLLTLDKIDFKGLLGDKVYRMWILSPSEFLNAIR
jgi:predicted nucleic acid-binding protein